MEIPVIFEDEYIKAVEKPAGVLAYPLPGSDEKAVGDMVGGFPIHRLDRDTSGILLLAKTEEYKKEFQKLFAAREIEKRYKALVWGRVEPETGEINIPLGRGAKDRLRVVAKEGGRESRTVYKVEKYFPSSKMSLVDVDLKTGRTHQIRVHFSAIGHPVVGDKKYSIRKTELERQFLHAYTINFTHPFTKEKISLHSDLPNDLSTYLSQLS